MPNLTEERRISTDKMCQSCGKNPTFNSFGHECPVCDDCLNYVGSCDECPGIVCILCWIECEACGNKNCEHQFDRCNECQSDFCLDCIDDQLCEDCRIEKQ